MERYASTEPGRADVAETGRRATRDRWDPVEARIANGEVGVDLQLFSPTGEPIGQPQAVDVEVRAEWESIGLIAIIVLVVAFLSLGVVRTVARRRRAAAAPPEEDHDAVDGVGNKDPDADGRGDADPDDADPSDIDPHDGDPEGADPDAPAGDTDDTDIEQETRP